jgi:hypothetical protein
VGIGYREQELQQASSALFSSNEANGIPQASFAGGTNIFIRGQQLDENPQSNTIIFHSAKYGVDIVAPLLTEDDAF